MTVEVLFNCVEVLPHCNSGSEKTGDYRPVSDSTTFHVSITGVPINRSFPDTPYREVGPERGRHTLFRLQPEGGGMPNRGFRVWRGPGRVSLRSLPRLPELDGSERSRWIFHKPLKTRDAL